MKMATAKRASSGALRIPSCPLKLLPLTIAPATRGHGLAYLFGHRPASPECRVAVRADPAATLDERARIQPRGPRFPRARGDRDRGLSEGRARTPRHNRAAERSVRGATRGTDGPIAQRSPVVRAWTFGSSATIGVGHALARGA